MLVIRDVQLKGLEVCLHPDYEHEAVAKLRAIFPELHDHADTDFRDHLRLASRKSIVYGIDDGDNLLLFAAFMILFGSEFDIAFPPTQSILTAPGRTAGEKMETLFKFGEYFETFLKEQAETPSAADSEA